MCGRFVSATDAEGLVRFFVVDERAPDDVPPSWNVAPTDRTFAVARHGDRRVLTTFNWGLVPFWAKDAKGAARQINARAETVATKPAFKESFARRRCLIPANGFYEWRRGADGSRQPFFVHRADGDPMAMAGVWASWRDPADRERRHLSCAVITTSASPAIAHIHDRMPVVLERDDWDTWLDGDSETAELALLLRPAPEDAIAFHPVAAAVGNVRNNTPDLLAPVS